VSVGVPPEAERLYGLPLGEFVDERDALARELRAEGRRDEAERIRALRRPPLALWAVNQLARRHGDEVAQLLAAGERMRSGESGAAEDVSLAVDRLVRSGREVLQQSGHAAGDTTLQRIAATLRAAPANEEHAAALRAGRLTEELEPAGFAAMAAFAAAPTPTGGAEAKSRPRASSDNRRKRLREAEAAVAAARKRASALGREADEAERAARRARAEADRAEAEAARAERNVDRLRS
jgi:hypothetical protein